MQYDFLLNDFVNVTLNNHAPFIVGTDKTLSFNEVHENFNKLKKLFSNLKYDKNKPIIIYGEKQANFPVAILVMLHLNIPYVSIDAVFPENRIKSIQETTKACGFINLTNNYLNLDCTIFIDKEFNLIKNNEISEAKEIDLTIENLSYVLFTSGSTGVPKGVQITRKSLNNFLNWYLTWPILQKDNVYMNQATFSFDVYWCDFFGAFHFGSLLVLNDLVVLKTPDLFLKRFESNLATTLFCTPSFISMYLTLPSFNQSNYPSFKHICLIGEDLPSITVKKLRKAFPDLKIINSYGPTETTCVITYIEITDDILNSEKSLPIGYCKPDTEVIIDNSDKNPSLEGELIIVGDNVSIGYCNRNDLNKEKYFTLNGKRAYRTGDLGYFKENILYFTGRIDNQIKLNGYRIELDEITNVLLKYPEISNAAVIPLKAGNAVKKIVAYVSFKSIVNFEVNDVLKKYLQEYIPIYMVPSEIIVLDELPLNTNYKTDKKALLELYINR
jgi:D-alanine--poly(phosphoribitol) ligase subunit 1